VFSQIKRNENGKLGACMDGLGSYGLKELAFLRLQKIFCAYRNTVRALYDWRNKLTVTVRKMSVLELASSRVRARIAKLTVKQ
jgi:hypothetical protein